MAMRYPANTYNIYGHPQWSEEVKPAYVDDDHTSVLDDKVLDPSSPIDLVPAHDSRRASMIKVEDEFAGPMAMWTERPHGAMAQMRQYSFASVPPVHPGGQSLNRVQDPTYAASYTQAQAWNLSAHSESSTPTPIYTSSHDGYGQQPVQYPGGPLNYSGFQQQHHHQHQQPQDPSSAVSMSPQSSQGGWASAASSDGAEQRHHPRSPRYRATSPMTVLRSDGIRKKNARFEIPKERNLSNIDELIMQSKDEVEKKELKQQKRLLRNRQAALDSRQRKKTHTEKLEQEKKTFNTQKTELEDTMAQIENTFHVEREQWMQERQQYEHHIQSLEFERDEAIRTRTLETAELRRRNNTLMDHVRDFERQQNSRGYVAATGHDNFQGDFTEFGALDLDDSWDDGYSFINADDCRMEGEESPRREATPRPTASTSTAAGKALGKSELGFSWNTFYMCLLFGAFIASNSGTNDSGTKSASTSALPPNMPALSEDYRSEAGNVLKAVLASGPESGQETLPVRPLSSTTARMPTTITGSEFSRLSQQQLHHQPGPSSLESLHNSLTTPTRQQENAAAFAMSAASYSHLTNANGILDEDDDDDDVPQGQPTKLQQLFASMQAERDGLEKMNGLGGKARERSVLLERVSEKVLKDFREIVGMNAALQRE